MKNPFALKKHFVFSFLVVLWIGMVLLPSSTKAANPDCSYKEINRLQKMASQVTYQYENDISNNFLLTFKNVTEEIYLKDDAGISYYWDPNENKIQSVYIDGLEGGKTYTFSVYTYGACEEEKIRTIYINIPRVNPYASRRECQGLTNFSLCKKWTNTDNLTEETFLKRIEEYKKQQEKKETSTTKPPETNQSKWSILINNYDIILLVVIFASLTIITIIKLKERRNRNKLL